MRRDVCHVGVVVRVQLQEGWRAVRWQWELRIGGGHRRPDAGESGGVRQRQRRAREADIIKDINPVRIDMDIAYPVTRKPYFRIRFRFVICVTFVRSEAPRSDVILP